MEGGSDDLPLHLVLLVLGVDQAIAQGSREVLLGRSWLVVIVRTVVQNFGECVGTGQEDPRFAMGETAEVNHAIVGNLLHDPQQIPSGRPGDQLGGVGGKEMLCWRRG